MTNPAPERLGPHKEALLLVESARAQLDRVDALLRLAQLDRNRKGLDDMDEKGETKCQKTTI